MGGCESKEIGDDAEISLDTYKTSDPVRFLEAV